MNKRNSGILMHVSSLWGNYSEGSFGNEARQWVDFLAAAGFSVWQVLPFCLPDEYNSPYKSFGAFSINPYFIDLPTLREQGLITEHELAAACQHVPYSCEFDRLNKERLALLSRAASRVTHRAPIEEFLATHPQTAAFCLYMAKRAYNGDKCWNEWTRDGYDADVLFAWQFMQYEAVRQWKEIRAYANARGIEIVGDVPIYVAYDSADVWANREQFQLDAKGRMKKVAGVPPDYFSADGQLWGNPLYDWARMKKDGYAWWQARMTFMMELFDGVRIDHFRGFESYFSIPADATTARDGVWVKGPGMSLLRALANICEGKRMIAEDLGDITPAVAELVKKSGYPGMRVLQFAFLGDENSPHQPHNYDFNCVAYTGTHDNNTLLGYVWDQDEATKRHLMAYCGFTGDWNACYDSVLRTMFASHAGLLMLPVQDLFLFGKDTRLNTPGAADGNWAYRVTREQYESLSPEKFLAWNRLYGRGTAKT